MRRDVAQLAAFAEVLADYWRLIAEQLIRNEGIPGYSPDDFPLAHRDRNWELVRYSWDEKTGLARLAYEHRYTDGKIEEVRYQGRYWLPEEVRARLVPQVKAQPRKRRAPIQMDSKSRINNQLSQLNGVGS